MTQGLDGVEELLHGELLSAYEALGFAERDARRLKEWFKTAESADMDPVSAEQKMSRHAREGFCRADQM